MADHWPEHLKPADGITFIPLIPKLHENGHRQTKNHEQYSFNFCDGVGHTDGEGPERIWSAHNALGSATKTMGPGSRHDVLDDHFGHWNHEKYISMGELSRRNRWVSWGLTTWFSGKSLMRRYQKALPERNKQAEAHRGFTASLNPKDVERWTKMCEQWGAEGFPRTMESPYSIEGASMYLCLYSFFGS